MRANGHSGFNRRTFGTAPMTMSRPLAVMGLDDAFNDQGMPAWSARNPAYFGGSTAPSMPSMPPRIRRMKRMHDDDEVPDDEGDEHWRSIGKKRCCELSLFGIPLHSVFSFPPAGYYASISRKVFSEAVVYIMIRSADRYLMRDVYNVHENVHHTDSGFSRFAKIMGLSFFAATVYYWVTGGLDLVENAATSTGKTAGFAHVDDENKRKISSVETNEFF